MLLKPPKSVLDVELRSPQDSQNVSAIASGHFDNGLRMYHEGHYQDAIKEFQQAILIDPTFAVASYFNIGLAYERQKKYTLSKNAYLEALEREPFLVGALSNLCSVFLNQQQWDDAFAAANRILEIEPHNKFATERKAYSFLAKQMWDDAYILLEQLLKTEVRDASLHLYKAYVCRQLRKNREAEAEYRLAIECDSIWIESYVCLAEFYCSTKQRRLAARTAIKGLSMIARGKFHN